MARPRPAECEKNASTQRFFTLKHFDRYFMLGETIEETEALFTLVT